MRIVAPLLLTGFAYAELESPIERVLTLLDNLKKKVISDEEGEQKEYDKYACWAERTFKNKRKDIVDLKQNLGETEDEINKQAGLKATEASKLAQKQAASKKNAEENEAHEAKAAADAADFADTITDLTTQIGLIKRAKEALVGAGGTDRQTDVKLLSITEGLRGMHAVRAADAPVFRQFVESPSQFLQGVNKYQSQSGQIQGIIADMLDQANTDKKSTEDAEAAAKKAATTKRAALSEEKADIDDAITLADKNLSTATQLLSDARKSKADDTAELAGTEKFLEDTIAAAKDRAEEHAKNSFSRASEIKAIDAASDFLSKGKDAETDRDAEAVRQKKAAKGGFLQRHQTFLQQAQVPGAKFEVVIQFVEKFIEKLDREQKADEEDKRKCEADTAIIASREKSQTHEETKLQGEEDSVKATIVKLGSDKETLAGKRKDLKEEMKEAATERKVENKAWINKVAAQRKIIPLVQGALKSMKGAYGLVQAGPPEGEYTIDKDKFQSSTENKNRGQKRKEGGQILSILEMIIQDAKAETRRLNDAEAKRDSEYKGQRADDLETVTALDDRISENTKITNRNVESGVAIDGEQAALGEEQKALKNSKLAQQKRCEWLKTDYDARKQQRKAERENFQNAKSALSGADMEGTATAPVL